MMTTTTTHRHEYRTDLADWWCHDCETVTDYCQDLNPFDDDDEDETPDALTERFQECDEWQRQAFRAWYESGDYVSDGDDLPSLSDFEEAYCGEWDGWRQYAEEMADEMIHPTGPADEFLARYFDYDKFARDLAFDYTTVPAPHGLGIFVFRNL